MMGTMSPTEQIPPFEQFYVAHRDEVLAYLRRLLGSRAEDAWQETFLKALRAYDRLEHGRHLRAWVFTIATNVAMDVLRPTASASLAQAPEPLVELHRDAFKELEHLTEELPPTERAAVVLRYGYDLPYVQIANALGSSEEAARAAASSGVRRLGGHMNVTPELDAQFRTAAVREGLVDVRYDVVASPVGDLLVAATDRGLARIHFDPAGQEEVLARIFGKRVLRSPIDEVRRELDEYFEGRRREFDLPLDLRVIPFNAEVLGQLARVPYGTTTTYGALAQRSAGRVLHARSARS